MDNTDNRLGVRYNRKAALEGNNEDRLKQATRAALTACRRLEEEPRLEESFVSAARKSKFSSTTACSRRIPTRLEKRPILNSALSPGSCFAEPIIP